MKLNVRKLVSAAVVGALYAVLTMALSPISYGALQFRVSEVLCLLPFFMPWTVWGLFLGCAISNILSTAGVFDVVFGSLATLAAALCVARMGKIGADSVWCKLLSCVFPIVINGVVIGAVLALCLASADAFWMSLLLYGGQVAVGEAGVMLILGFPAMLYMPKQRFFIRLVQSFDN